MIYSYTSVIYRLANPCTEDDEICRPTFSTHHILNLTNDTAQFAVCTCINISCRWKVWREKSSIVLKSKDIMCANLCSLWHALRHIEISNISW